MSIEIIDSAEIKNSGGALLLLAKSKYGDKYIAEIRDGIGLVAFEYEDCVLCAKEYIYGNIVSCSKILLEICIAHNKKLTMYIHKNDKFYTFNPSECLGDGKPNFRGGVEMINFPIRLGTNAFKSNTNSGYAFMDYNKIPLKDKGQRRLF